MPFLALFALTLTSPEPVQVAAPACGVSVQFGSYAMGIDRAAFDKVQALLKRDARVQGVELRRWGREGETTLCVTLRRDRDARAVFSKVKQVLPARPRGPITVETAGGARFAVPAKR